MKKAVRIEKKVNSMVFCAFHLIRQFQIINFYFRLRTLYVNDGKNVNDGNLVTSQVVWLIDQTIPMTVKLFNIQII